MRSRRRLHSGAEVRFLTKAKKYRFECIQGFVALTWRRCNAPERFALSSADLHNNKNPRRLHGADKGVDMTIGKILFGTSCLVLAGAVSAQTLTIATVNNADMIRM